MGVLSTRAKRLHRRRFELETGEVRQLSIFPFFERRGRVRGLMITDPAQGTISAVGWRPGVLQLRMFGPDRLRVLPGDLEPLSAADPGALPSLWHFDPWWVLRDEPFADQDVVPLLAATNCVDALGGKRSSLVFRRDLSAVHWVGTASGNITAWTPNLLPSEQPEQAWESAFGRREPDMRWSLRPMWQPGS